MVGRKKETESSKVMKGGVFFRDQSKAERRLMSVPWGRAPVVQVENLFGVEQVVEFPKNSVGEEKE